MDLFPQPVTPYVTAAEFAAHPTYLDLQDLRVGVPSDDDQTDELVNILLMASAWADRTCNQVLRAHQVSVQTRARIDRDGTLAIVLPDFPFRSLQSLSYGQAFGSMTTLPAATTPVRIRSQRVLLVPVGAGAGTAGSWLDVDLLYTAGHVSTILTADAAAGVTSLTVSDPTGIRPGASYRLWEPGSEETVTVSPTWTPPDVTTPPTPAAVELATATRNPHTAGCGWSGMPPDMRLAVTNYTVAQLLRPDTSAEDSFPDTPLASGTRQKDPRKDGSGLVSEGVRLLNAFARRV